MLSTEVNYLKVQMIDFNKTQNIILEKIEKDINSRRDDFNNFKRWFVGVLLTVIIAIFGSLFTGLDRIGTKMDSKFTEVNKSLESNRIEINQIKLQLEINEQKKGKN